MDRTFVNPKYQRAWDHHGWKSLNSVVKHFLPDYRQRRKVTVCRVEISAGDGITDAFFKLYHHRAGGWRFWMRASKARREFENYLTFARLEVPAAEAIACGEERDKLGRLQRAFILTRAVPNACGLDEFFKRSPPCRERRDVLDELAHSLRRLHGESFFYYDLVWRNILISRDASETPRAFLIDCPRGSQSASSVERKRLRDLASLDKSGAQFCSRSERLRFLLRYSGKTRSDDGIRTLVRACLKYRRHRWPEDWRGK
jgi:hypothetical protein